MSRKKKPTFIDLFCGCGGFSLGMQRAGFTELAAIDSNAEAISVFRRNFPRVPALSLPDLLADFQQLAVLTCDQLNSLTRVSSLDSPFAESVAVRFTRYFGRIGTPNLDLDFIIAQMLSDSPRDKPASP